MKKLLLFFTSILLLNTSSHSQVTLDHVFHKESTEFFITDIGNNDLKYVFEDTSGFKMYNLDYSLYMNVVTPIPLWKSPNYYLIAYITKSLFDCDSSNIEYVITAPTHLGNFYIYRTNGTLLFEKDSVTGIYDIVAADGQIQEKPIFKTPIGTKLWLIRNCCIQDSIWVYSLCGDIPTVVYDNFLDESYVKVFPNPTNGIINFQITQPSNQEKFKLTIYNSSFQKVDEANIIEKNYQLDTKQKSLSSGTYLFDLRTENKIYQTGKFVLTK